MQNQQTGQSWQNGSDPFFRQTGSSNWNTEAASSIDTKDLSVIQDEMYAEALLYKKCTVYANYFTDQTLKNLATTAAQHHRQHFDTLHGYLNGSY
ncbi:MAG: hypothetical protein J1E60_03075 [Christensenellaceae bacterium]|nr:hypothetical protein [Christensenellaceae bacterium]